MKILDELVELAEKADAVANLMDGVNPHTILAIAEAFRALEQRAEAAESENKRLSRNYQSVIDQHMPRTGDGCDEGWSRIIEAQELQPKLTAAEAIVADVEEVINLLSEREWAEHCTKTDTGKRLEEAITKLHDEAAPAVSLADLVPDEMPAEISRKFLSEFYVSPHISGIAWKLIRVAILRKIEEEK